MSVENPPYRGEEHFGSTTWKKMCTFADLLAREGEKRGLIGPREYEKIWSRHILNSTVIADFINDGAQLTDIGSGAGFPGIVTAIMRPDISVTLIDSMDRRCQWLMYVSENLNLNNVHVRHVRAQDLKGNFQTDVATARAVASVAKLLPLTMPIIRGGGTLLALKGERVYQEIDDALPELQKYHVEFADVHTVVPFGCKEPTRVLEIRKK